MSSSFKITTWGDYGTMQLRTGTGTLFLDKDDVKKLREHFREQENTSSSREA